jgi:Zn-dependent M28 family amino/carboxypeptidase
MRTTWPAQSQRPEGELTDWVDQVRIPAVQVSSDFAERLLQLAGKRLSDLAHQAEADGGVTSVPISGIEVRVAAAVDRNTVDVHNVLGLIEGSDPLLKNDWIIIGAHFDHTGAEPTRTFNGADDNASGVAGILEVAEAYALARSQGPGPRRSILLAGWNAEERGLLGAWAFTNRPAVPLEHIVAVLNMDMIGRDEEVPPNGGTRFTGLDPQTAASNHNAVHVMGYSRSADLRQTAELANRSIGLDLRFRYDNNRSNLLRRSDHWPFLFRGVPALFIHTGLHPDYHTERDRPETLNYEKMERIVRLVYQMSWHLADAPERPRLDH